MMCMVLLAGAFLLTVKPLPVRAANKLYKWKSSYIMPIYKDKMYNWDNYTLRLTDSTKKANKIDIQYLKSSNPKVVSINSHYPTYIQLKIRKTGSTKIRMRFTFKGKTYRYQTTIKVKKYDNPFESLQIGDENLVSRLNKRPDANFDGEGILNYRLKKGWIIKEAYYQDISEDGDWNEKKIVFDGQYIRIEGWDYINIKCYNPSTKMTVNIMIGGEVQIS